MAKLEQFPIERAIISVWDKSGILPLAEMLVARQVTIFSTGGTYDALKAHGLAVTRVEELTNFPEILGGRVKTLHPAIFGGILADVDNSRHVNDLQRAALAPFQLVVVNLYPFVESLRKGEKTFNEMIEMIDIGGPAMLRAAAKNFRNVAVLSDPTQYPEFQRRLTENAISLDYRQQLAQQVFEKTTAYDTEIARFLSSDKSELPQVWHENFRRVQTLRYGENPDQTAALYAPYFQPDWQPFKQLQGKEISYNNYHDCLAAYRLVTSFKMKQAVVVNVKHTNPCGLGVGNTALAAYRRAVAADPVSYFGGIVGTNQPVNAEFAQELSASFLECIVAPEFDENALFILSKKKNLRLLVPCPERLAMNLDIRNYGSGLLVQTISAAPDDESTWRVVTERQPAPEHWSAIRLAWQLVKHVKSNAIVFCDANGSVGIGAGQMSRVDAVKIAIRKAQEAGLDLSNTVMASDAFFPFRDSVDVAAEHQIAGIIQPGGSLRDQDSITACNEHHLFMIFTGRRVFKH